MPSRDLAQIAVRIRVDSDFYHISAIVGAYIRHERTSYDATLAATPAQRYSGAWQAARAQVNPQVSHILNSWR